MASSKGSGNRNPPTKRLGTTRRPLKISPKQNADMRDALQPDSGDLPLTRTAFEESSGHTRKTRKMVWQRGEAGADRTDEERAEDAGQRVGHRIHLSPEALGVDTIVRFFARAGAAPGSWMSNTRSVLGGPVRSKGPLTATPCALRTSMRK